MLTGGNGAGVQPVMQGWGGPSLFLLPVACVGLRISSEQVPRACVIFVAAKRVFDEFGGKLGTIAFVACLAAYGMWTVNSR